MYFNAFYIFEWFFLSISEFLPSSKAYTHDGSEGGQCQDQIRVSGAEAHLCDRWI